MRRHLNPLIGVYLGVMLGSLVAQVAWGFTTPLGVALFLTSGLAITATFIRRGGTQ